MKTPFQQIAELDSFKRRYAKDAAGHEHSAENGQFVSGGGSAKHDAPFTAKTYDELQQQVFDRIKTVFGHDVDFENSGISLKMRPVEMLDRAHDFMQRNKRGVDCSIFGKIEDRLWELPEHVTDSPKK